MFALGINFWNAAAAPPISAAPPLKDYLVSWWEGGPSDVGFSRRNDLYGPYFLDYCAESAVRTGKIGVAADIGGTNYLRTVSGTNNHTSSLLGAGRNIWRCGWFKFDTLSANQSLWADYGGYAPDRQFLLQYNNTTQKIELIWCANLNASRVTLTDSMTPVVDVWYFIAFGRSNTNSQIWLTITPDTNALPTAAVTLASTSTQQAIGGSNWHTIGANDSGSNKMDGAVNQFAVFHSEYSSDYVAWLYNAGAGRQYSDLVYSVAPTLGYFHNFEADTPPEPVRYTYQDIWPLTTRVVDPANASNFVSKLDGSWKQTQVFNDSSTDYWTTVNEGRITVRVYVLAWVDGAMVFQLDGKSNNKFIAGQAKGFDANEGLGSLFNTNGPSNDRGLSWGGITTSGYIMPLNQWVLLDYRFKRAATANKLELWADGVRIIASTAAISTISTMTTFHHISVGNDRVNASNYLMDDFTISPNSLLI
jgi:hypothetical protein